MCHGHAGTIVVSKVAGTDEIVGGYNPLVWDNSIEDVRMKTNDSFIFSLKNGNIQNSILSRVIDSRNALYYRNFNLQNFYGPWFGFSEFLMESKVSDFTQDKLCQCFRYNSPEYDQCYEKPIRTTNEGFSIVDYEVFKIQCLYRSITYPCNASAQRDMFLDWQYFLTRCKQQMTVATNAKMYSDLHKGFPELFHFEILTIE
ncbi:hypothetical protein Glove_395g5 [Diversispora epigaea]|uniref:TLDc domain-containing protein n=1 Tax=Diversispora epigaea TaxID=1348612 RepID=A0A397H9F9_9GLOM|nr:hypothetical protein Glove_395g5 [Diversispora epigaea]